MSLSEELSWRGFINQTTFGDLSDLDENSRTFYLGVDPSAPSMHIGNLAAVMLVRHLADAGHKPIVLVGGATGMIGDPKQDVERDLKTLDEIAHNKAGIAAQYRSLLDGKTFELVDNYDWFKDIGYLNFLRDIGKHFSMTQLLDREFIKARIGEGGVGISYAEFSYSLIQGYDFLHLYREHGATMQIGGSDQWGNMISGAQMIKKLEGAEAHVLTVPLVLDKKTGKKFGKSEGNAVWLDPDMTSPYKFYQFWLNTNDETAEDLIKIYTLLDRPVIEELIAEHQKNPGARELQKTLAFEVTKLVHGEARAENARNVTAVLFGGTPFESLLDEEVDMLALEIPVAVSSDAIHALTSTDIAKSNGDAKRLIESGAISVNGEKIVENVQLTGKNLVKKGKNTFILIR
ncbi:MAG TPA: tyrosine--tRNA ligase [Candidatus Saccharimonadales bacterium]